MKQKAVIKPLSKPKVILLTAILLSLAVIFTITAIRAYDKMLRESYPRSFSELVTKYAEQYDLSEEFIYAVIHTESGFRPAVVSHAGAQGLMQIMPDTHDWIEFKLGIKQSNDIFDPETNISYGTYYLSYLLNKYNDEKCALAAYNAGSTSVDRWLSDTRYSDDGITLKKIPYNETKNYVEKVAKSKAMYIKLYGDKK